ncbi:MAG: ATP-dependent DNA helicase, partial [Chloroflexi bacterium]|nr:ATP-dependent DNA helicase [Chloroflexota bacterium]
NAIAEDAIKSRAFQLLKRYGVMGRELLAREPMAPLLRDLLRVYRQAEARGTIRGGRFVAGYLGEQFALPEAIEMLRSVRKIEPTGQLLRVSACDPLNQVGILTPGPRVSASLGNLVLYRDGVPIASIEGGKLVERTPLDDETRREALALAHPRLLARSRR